MDTRTWRGNIQGQTCLLYAVSGTWVSFYHVRTRYPPRELSKGAADTDSSSHPLVCVTVCLNQIDVDHDAELVNLMLKRGRPKRQLTNIALCASQRASYRS